MRVPSNGAVFLVLPALYYGVESCSFGHYSRYVWSESVKLAAAESGVGATRE